MMSNDELRKKAEELVHNKAAGPSQNEEGRSPEEAKGLIHGLRVHQIELELQNDELRRAQLELDAERVRYFDLYDLAPVGYFTVSESGVILGANLTASTLLGLSRDLIIKWPFSRFIFKDDSNLYHVHFKQLMETGEPQSFDLRMLCQDGAVFWVRLQATKAQVDGGGTQCRVVMSDITERKQMEYNLRLSEKHMTMAQRIGHTGSWTYNLKTNAIWGSAEGLRIFGYPPVAKYWPIEEIEACIPERERVHQALVDLLSEGKTYNLEYLINPADGSPSKIVHSVAMLENDGMGNPLQVMGFVQDISGRKRAEEALRESEERYRALFTRAVDGVFILSTDGSLVEVNESLASMHGYSVQEMLQFSLKDLDTPETARCMPERMKKIMAGQSLIFEVEHYHKDGHVFPLEVSASLISSGGKKYVQCFHRNITDRKHAEERIQRSLQEKEVLLKEIHHRVKNNMTVIYSLLNLQANVTADKAARAILEEARDRVNMMTLIHKKLYQSKDLAHIDYKEYLRDLVSGIADTYQRRDVVVTVEMESLFFDVTVGIPCGLIANELVSNCFKYAFPEGRKGTIKIGINKDSEGNNVLTVADNGVGFPETTDFRKTTSLGLQLVNVLTGQIQGKIELVRNEGTTFKITFPGATE